MPGRTAGVRPIAGGIAVVLAMATAAWAAETKPPLEIDEQARQVLDDFARYDRELKSFQVVIETQIALDSDQAVARSYAVSTMPHTVLIGKDGLVKVVCVDKSKNLENELRADLEALLTGRNSTPKTAAAKNSLK